MNLRLWAKVSYLPHILSFIQEFLDRTARLHGCIDLEWLRHAPPKDVK